MTITALSIVTAMYKRCNRLSPGETLNADDFAFGFDALNEFVDELSANAQFLYKTTITSAAQTGNITLAAGSWAAIPAGTPIVSMAANGIPLDPITTSQYNALYDPTVTGEPRVFDHDGMATVRLYPVPTGQTIRIETRSGVAAFADSETEYTVPPGYQSGLIASGAVRIAPNILGKIPPDLLRREMRAWHFLKNPDPAVIDTIGYSQRHHNRDVLYGWF
jgi:hypothetical protein